MQLRRGFRGGAGGDGKRMDAAAQLLRQHVVHATMACDTRQPGEGIGHDLDPEVTLATLPRTGVACVEMRFIHHCKGRGMERPGELVADRIGNGHHAM